MRQTHLLRPFTLGVSAFLLAEGLWGLFQSPVFGILTTNTTHALIHLALAGVGFWAAMRHHTRGFNEFLGGLLFGVGALFFVPGLSGLLVSVLNLNTAVAVLNLVLGGLALALVYADAPARIHSHG